MKKAILGRKLGMTQIFDEEGRMLPVTVIEAGPCYEPVGELTVEEKEKLRKVLKEMELI